MKTINNYKDCDLAISLTLSRNYYYALIRCLQELRDDLCLEGINADDVAHLLLEVADNVTIDVKADKFTLTMDRDFSFRIYCALFEYILTLPYWEPAMKLLEKFAEIRDTVLDEQRTGGDPRA